MEECGELIRACSKVLRHGIDDPKYLNNLQEEMADVKAMIMILSKAYDLDPSKTEDLVQKRLTKMLNPNYT
jgi:NTP pyrophosphatase (non-canonical NTP hydrolase)